MYISNAHYNDLEDLILESLYLINKDKSFLKDKNKKELFYECALKYCNLKLQKFKHFSENYRELAILPSTLRESLNVREYKLLKEGILDTIGNVASAAYEKVKGWASDALDFAQKSPAAFAQSIADVVSIFDPTGLVDLINGSIYLARGENLSAFFCGIGAIFTLPGFLASLTGAGAVAGVPMIVAGKTIKNILRYGGKISEPLLKFGAKVLKSGGVVEKMLAYAAKIPGLGKFIEFFKNMTPKFIKAVEGGGSSQSMLSKAFGTASDFIKAPGKAAEDLIARGTKITGEKAAAMIKPEMAKSKLGKAVQVGGAGLTLGAMGSGQEQPEQQANVASSDADSDAEQYELSDEDLEGLV